MTPLNPDYETYVRRLFNRAAFIQDLGLELSDLGPGWCETSLIIRPSHLQQNGFVHAGVQATVADHTSGGAAGTLLSADQLPLTAEFKINFLRPAAGERITARARVLKPGRMLSIVETEVFAHRNEHPPSLIAKALVTIAVTTPTGSAS